MEQFLRNFFNNDSVCLGLCDLQRKIAGVSFNNPPAHMQAPVHTPQPQVYHQAYAQARRVWWAGWKDRVVPPLLSMRRHIRCR